MIRKIQIQDYRSCIDTTFELHPHLSVLIGPNSSGKTNILNAILLLKKLTEEEEYRYQEEEKPSGQCILKVWFDIDEKTVILDANININTDDENNDIVLSSLQKWYVKDFTDSAKRIQVPLSLLRYIGLEDIHEGRSRIYYPYPNIILKKLGEIPGAVRKSLLEISQYISGMTYYSASQFTNPSNCPVSFEMEKEGERRRGVRLRGHAKFLYDLYTEYKQDSKRYQQFIEIIGPEGIGLVDGLKFNEIKTSSIHYSVKSGGSVRERKRDKVLVIPQFKIGKHELSPNQLSEGTFKTITLLFYLITESSSMFMVEEPEVCVHHGLLSSIIELIKIYSSSKQMVISTHSDFVLDEVLPENVFRVTNLMNEGTRVAHITKTMSPKEITALKRYLETEGNLGEYWKHGALE